MQHRVVEQRHEQLHLEVVADGRFGGCHGDSPVAQRAGQRIDLVIASGKDRNITRSHPPQPNQRLNSVGHALEEVTPDLPEFERRNGLNALLPVMGFQSGRRAENRRKDGIGRPNQLSRER